MHVPTAAAKSYLCTRGYFPGIKLPEHEADHHCVVQSLRILGTGICLCYVGLVNCDNFALVLIVYSRASIFVINWDDETVTDFRFASI
jgi:hypothetical protein